MCSVYDVRDPDTDHAPEADDRSEDPGTEESVPDSEFVVHTEEPCR